MPLIKSIEGPKGSVSNFHVVDYVEVFRLGSRLGWRARTRSYASAEAYRLNPGEIVSSDTVVGVPYSPGDDPIRAFEQAAVAAEGSPFQSADIVDDVDHASPIELLKLDRWSKIKLARDRHLASGVATPFGVFDSDLTSIVNLLGAATVASSAPSDWTEQWILKDRSTVTLTRDQLLEVGALLAAFRSQTYRRGDELYRDIQLAETPEAVRAINWHQGLA